MYFPGWAMQVACFVFIQRRWEDDKKHLQNMLDYFCDIREPLQLLLFPEGTDLTGEKSRAHLASFLCSSVVRTNSFPLLRAALTLLCKQTFECDKASTNPWARTPPHAVISAGMCWSVNPSYKWHQWLKTLSDHNYTNQSPEDLNKGKINVSLHIMMSSGVQWRYIIIG